MVDIVWAAVRSKWTPSTWSRSPLSTRPTFAVLAKQILNPFDGGPLMLVPFTTKHLSTGSSFILFDRLLARFAVPPNDGILDLRDRTGPDEHRPTSSNAEVGRRWPELTTT